MPTLGKSPGRAITARGPYPLVDIEAVDNGFVVSVWGSDHPQRSIYSTLDEALEAARSALAPRTKPARKR